MHMLPFQSSYVQRLGHALVLFPQVSISAKQLPNFLHPISNTPCFNPLFPTPTANTAAQFLRRLHALYVDTLSSPFAVVGARLDAARFHGQVARLVFSNAADASANASGSSGLTGSGSVGGILLPPPASRS